MKTTYTQDIAYIAESLKSLVNFRHIEFSQVLLNEEYRGKSINDLLFVKKVRGIYFYTSAAQLDNMMTLTKHDVLPVYVGTDESTNLYEIW